MTITIYGDVTFTSVARVLATLYEKNVDFEFVTVNLKKGDNTTPEFLKLNPFGQTPVAKFSEDFCLFESRAIARVIAHKYEGQGTPLYGTNPKDRALVEQWVEVEAQNFHQPSLALVMELMVFPIYGKSTNDEVVTVQLAKLGTVLDVYEKHLATNKYMAGDFFSLADLVHLPNLYILIVVCKRHEIFESRPAVKAWWEDISSRPSWKKWQALAFPTK